MASCPRHQRLEGRGRDTQWKIEDCNGLQRDSDVSIAFGFPVPFGPRGFRGRGRARRGEERRRSSSADTRPVHIAS